MWSVVAAKKGPVPATQAVENKQELIRQKRADKIREFVYLFPFEEKAFNSTSPSRFIKLLDGKYANTRVYNGQVTFNEFAREIDYLTFALTGMLYNAQISPETKIKLAEVIDQVIHDRDEAKKKKFGDDLQPFNAANFASVASKCRLALGVLE